MNDTFLDQKTETPVPPVTAAPAVPALAQDPGPSLDDLLKLDDVSFLRKFQSRIASIFSNPLTALNGSARMIAELLARSGKPVIARMDMVQIKAWHDEWVKLQACIDNHGDDSADIAWEASERDLHNLAQSTDHIASTVLTRDEYHIKFERIRSACFFRQQSLYAKNISLAAAIAESVAEIIRDHAVSLEKTERERYTKYGLQFNGSPLVHAVKTAEKFLLARIAPPTGAAGPSLVLPWLILTP
jgi:hypothetical protein